MELLMEMARRDANLADLGLAFLDLSSARIGLKLFLCYFICSG